MASALGSLDDQLLQRERYFATVPKDDVAETALCPVGDTIVDQNMVWGVPSSVGFGTTSLAAMDFHFQRHRGGLAIVAVAEPLGGISAIVSVDFSAL